MKNANEPKPRISDDDPRMFEADNGRIVCASHLGMTARYTMRDLSGAKVRPLLVRERLEWENFLACEEGRRVHPCETCRNAGTPHPAGERVTPAADRGAPVVYYR